jgi:hypothetical protein
MYDWSQIFISAGETIGQTFNVAKQSKRLIEEAGFVDVVEKKYKMPVGAWMADERWKELGRWNLLYLSTGLEGMQLWILKTVLGVSYVSLTSKFVDSGEESSEHIVEVLLTDGSGIISRSKLCQDECDRH